MEPMKESVGKIFGCSPADRALRGFFETSEGMEIAGEH